MVSFLYFLLHILLWRLGASPHEDFQARVVVQKVSQSYGSSEQHERRLQDAATCEEVHTAGTWGPMRIGYEMVDIDSVPSDLVDLVNQTVMARAVAYWSSVLQVRQAQSPLKMDRIGTGCFKYGFDTDWRCSGMQSPTCGLMTIPDKYLRSKRACQEVCGPRCTGSCVQGGSCACDVDEWLVQQDNYCCYLTPQAGCPSDCSLANATQVSNGASGGFVCEGGCVDAPEGEGAVGEDLHVFVKIEDSAECQSSSTLLAYAISCGVDQCDRPVFGFINFCPSQLSTSPDDLSEMISTALHELAHVLVFSNEHFRNFRNADGTPMIPRGAEDPRLYQDEVRYSCSADSFLWNDTGGSRRYVDLSPDILDTFDERGYSCQCPIGTPSLNPGCFYPAGAPYLQMPSCVVRLKTPTVLREVRDFFDCPTLAGAELENQEGSGCSIINSHWEQRVFTSELMAPASSEHLIDTYVSRVSLAVFQDSGWYNANLSAADPLIPGVHWGYKQGCNFATAKCVDGGTPVSPHFCSSSADVSCSLDRKSVLGCDIQLLDSVPPVYQYTPDNGLGRLAAADYCPHYAVRYVNRVCSNNESVTVPYGNVNFMKEVFSAESRCFMSTLHQDVPADNGGTFVASPDDFVNERPVCYKVACVDGGQSYQLQVADQTDPTAFLSVGSCTSEGQKLTLAGAGGTITCAAPAQVCSDLSSRHVLGDEWKHAPAQETSTTATSTTRSTTTLTSTTASTTTHSGATLTSTSTITGTSSKIAGTITTTGSTLTSTSVASESDELAAAGRSAGMMAAVLLLITSAVCM